ncbi:hypothetical protein MMC19_000451 [Ptychographa xylographoides]|nr:hypothetical protein [Ptychographa xylographoides]
MLLIPFLLALLFVRVGRAALDEIICHDDILLRKTPSPGPRGERTDRVNGFLEAAFQSGLFPVIRGRMAAYVASHNFPPGAARLFATSQPLQRPIYTIECQDAVSLIPDASLSPNQANVGTVTHPNLRYPDAQRENVLRHRLDAIYVAGNCAVQIIRRPGANSGPRHADATAMALTVYPHARERALAVILQCLSLSRDRPIHRFGYTGTRSVLNGQNFDYVVAVTLWPGDASLANPGEHFYDRNGLIQAPDDDVRGSAVFTSFPFVRAFS